MVENIYINEKILEGIAHIRKKRNRPNYNTILSYVNRGEETQVDMATVKDIIQGMLSAGIIFDKGKENAESFYLKEDKVISDTEASKDHRLDNSRNVMEKVVGDIDESIIYNIISEKIQTEVKTQLTPTIDKLLNDDYFINSIKSNQNVNINYDGDLYVKALRDIITFLNEQVITKDHTIELLLSKIPSIDKKNANYDSLNKQATDTVKIGKNISLKKCCK